VLNADNAATLLPEYNADPAAYRAVHPAATWIGDELFRHALADADPDKDGVVFPACGNAAGKTTAISFSGVSANFTAAILDSTFSNPDHANRLVGQARKADKRTSILYLNSAISTNTVP
jgi:hypothetical protein